MADALVKPSDLKRHLLDGCGYRPELIEEDYTFAADKIIGLAAFAHQPFDARSACIAAIDCRSEDPWSEVMACREFGAPVVFACLGDRLYDLPARAERVLLNQFSGKVRPGVPGRFSSYYPDGFTACVPLYVYLSDAYQQFLRNGTVAVPADVRTRYDELVDKRLQTELTRAERDKLHRLEAEMDGSDYAAHQPDDSWLEACEAEQRASRRRMDRIGNKIVDLT